MAKRTASEIYQLSRAAGLSVAASIVAVAVSLAESSGDDNALGDLNLQNQTWGPSVGLWQIRTLKADTGSGTDRDINALKGNPTRQAQAMFRISQEGKDWSPWTVYNRGTYQQYLGQAENAAKATGAAVQTTTAPATLPAADAVVTGAQTLLIQLAGAALGLVLIGGGLVLAMQPAVKRSVSKTVKTITGAVGL